MKRYMNKVVILLIILTLSLILVSCKSDFSEFSGVYEMTEYIVDETEVVYDFELIDKYEIELRNDGYAVHTLKLGVMEEEEMFSNHYDISKKKNEIYFYIKDGLLVLNKETWDFTESVITIKGLVVPIVDEPNVDNESHFVTVTIKFSRDN